MAILTSTSNSGWSLLQKAQSITATCSENADAQAAIVLAYSALEAFVSQLEWLARRETDLPKMQELAVFLMALEDIRAQLKRKLDAIMVTLTSKRANWGGTPFQDLAHLKLLRDWCVHPKPVVGNTAKDVADSCEARFFVERSLIDESVLGHHVTWDNVVFVKPVAEWACETVRAVIAHVLDQLPISDAATRARLSWQRAV
ncbi:hypothetical protein [Methyloglobulus sp.]|uniref:hypothetical protein n=1 Tax=Methyloglobulus sp. TaxID=2518622 RepID=UPI0039891D86